MDAAVRHARECLEAARQLNVPEGFWGQFFHGAGAAANPTTSSGIGAMGGAALGSIFFPGIGTAIGGAVGAMVGNSQSSKQQQSVLERCDASYNQLAPAAVSVFWLAWDQLIDLVEKVGGPSLPGSLSLQTAESRMGELLERVTAGRAGYADVVAFIEEDGPNPGALRAAFYLGLDGDAERPQLLGYADALMRDFPQRVDGFEATADLCLSQDDWSGAIASAERGLKLAPAHGPLIVSCIEAYGALGEMSEAESRASRLGQSADAAQLTTDPWLAYVRGVCRGAYPDRVVAAVRAWLRAYDNPAAVARLMRSCPVISKRFEEIARLMLELTPFACGGVAALRAIVASYLRGDGQATFLDGFPADRWANARTAFARLDPREEPLFFRDWSMWSDGKAGMALTTERICWKCLFASPLSFRFRDVSLEGCKADGQYLEINGERLDLEDAATASAVANVVAEILLFRGGAPAG